MTSYSCKVCDGTDMNLVDGFYYCVECGTQDVNVRETVVEQTVLADGTFAHTTARKLTTAVQAKQINEMSPEWNKWHAYNFILAGLTEELLNLGAETSVKTAILWIWTKYIKMFQVTDVDKNKSQLDNESFNETIHSDGEEKVDDANTDDSDDENDKSTISKTSRNKKTKTDKFRRDIKIVTKGTLLTLIYIALNLDRSEIQLSHLLRFIKEGRLSLYNCTKYVPDEINTKSIPHWKNFILCQNDYTPKIIRTLAMTFFKRLDLGVPLVPDLNKMISNYVKELCLPSEFKTLVISLMNLMPCEFLKLDTRAKQTLVRIPDYEGVCMSYILIALKMCFGLDDQYEFKISDQVDKINYEKNYSKSYKLGLYSDSTERLFSFQDWYQFLLFRKTILCKYYLPMARIYKLPVDDCVLMEHLNERKTRTIKLSDNVTMDIINKITVEKTVSVIPKKEFPATLTPMSTYTEIILEYLQDPDLRLLLSEDFTKYSLKYAIIDLKFPEEYDDVDNTIEGVSEINKCINPFIIGTLKSSKGNTTMVFVRNCENKHWLKTKPPTTDHVTKESENKFNSDKDSDHGYDSNIESTPVESDEAMSDDSKENIKMKKEKAFEPIDEEDEGVCIFDDDFRDMDIFQKEKKDDAFEDSKNTEFQNDYGNDFQNTKLDFNDRLSESVNSEDNYNPNTFDRNSAIETLIEMACRKYKIPLPKEKQPRKRKKDFENQEAGETKVKRKKMDAPTGQSESIGSVKAIMEGYYKSIESDILEKVAEHVKSVIHNQSNQELLNNETFVNNHFDLEDTKMETSIGKIEDFNDQKENDINSSVISSIHPNVTINNTMSDLEDETTEDLNIKTPSNPKFDDSTHDIEQLYLKLNEDIEFNYNINFDADLDLDKIIHKTIENYANIGSQQNKIELIKSDSDSEDDIPLSEIANEKLSRMAKKRRRHIKRENLVSNLSIEKFNYWMRHYKSRAVTRSLDMSEKFDIEIMENCPKSFVFVIRQCAAILDCSTFCLYKCMQNLEETLSSYSDS
ncbi:uncharacterized protein LOC124539714 [Vanessa cardui]|uniref:uncharacterized protein LOC124539714 n=1 Tax=Vanessa cardui TaxID=171605 RepID=UPI001F12B717|nr:uncharacterized protein LOC124539714 [Vanessa cardui]